MSIKLFKFTAYLEVQCHDLSGDVQQDVLNLHEWAVNALSDNPAVNVGTSNLEPFKCDPCDCGMCKEDL